MTQCGCFGSLDSGDYLSPKLYFFLKQFEKVLFLYKKLSGLQEFVTKKYIFPKKLLSFPR